ncbi:ABC transporter substrate-binding protein [Desulfobacula phenolica]|uniref:Iron complex transport system substrate-binding protein n=1 Tax=Desulfobacula phenolica TaxID=90732 RepID=A0A1H2FJ22_9BACT|nr:ABC transporter substrate-binding protein [Desulfobacula phenolica]SDU07312.1 iron complex transport system substrate-binding protein [Desulfobacula phenolica]
MRRKSICLTLCLLCVLIFCSAIAANADYNSTKTTLTDALNRVVTIKKPVQKVAFTGICLTDALKIAGAWDKIVAREIVVLNPGFYPDIDRIPASNTTKGSPYSLNFERLLELNADCFLTFKAPMKGFEEMAEKIQSHIPVVALNLFDRHTIKRNFEILGTIFGKTDKISEYISWYENVLKRILDKTSKLATEQKKRYFLKWSPGKVEKFTTMSNQFIGMTTINEIAGGINVAADLNAYGGWIQSIDPEWLTQQDIDIIICEDSISNGFGPDMVDSSIVSSYRQQLMQIPFLAECKAVKNNAVYMISPHFLYTPAFVISLAYLAKWFHPDLFLNFDPRSVHQEYLTRFIGTDIDLSKRGIFVYPGF